MSPAQQKLMQYLPVVFAVFQVFFLAGLIIYYMAQAVLRIGQQAYITRRFYGHDESLGRQAQRAGEPGPRAGQDRTAAEAAAAAVRPGQAGAPARPTRGQPRGQGDERAQEDAGAAPSSDGSDEAHDRAEGPADADRQGRRGAAEAEPPSVGRAAAEPRAAANAGADTPTSSLTGRQCLGPVDERSG